MKRHIKYRTAKWIIKDSFEERLPLCAHEVSSTVTKYVRTKYNYQQTEAAGETRWPLFVLMLKNNFEVFPRNAWVSPDLIHILLPGETQSAEWLAFSCGRFTEVDLELAKFYSVSQCEISIFSLKVLCWRKKFCIWEQIAFWKLTFLWLQNLTWFFWPLELQPPKWGPCCLFTCQRKRRGFQFPQGVGFNRQFASLGTFLNDIWRPFVPLGGVGMLWGATGIWWVEARDAAKHPTMHRTAPAKESPTPNWQYCWGRDLALNKPSEHLSFIKITAALLIWCPNFSTVPWSHAHVLKSF